MRERETQCVKGRKGNTRNDVKNMRNAPTGFVSMETTLDRTSTLLSLNSRLIAKGNISIQQQVLEKKK